MLKKVWPRLEILWHGGHSSAGDSEMSHLEILLHGGDSSAGDSERPHLEILWHGGDSSAGDSERSNKERKTENEKHKRMDRNIGSLQIPWHLDQPRLK